MVTTHVKELARELDRLTVCREVVEAARALEQKLALLEPVINTAFLFQQIHGFPYHGDTYAAELTRLRTALLEGAQLERTS